MLVESLISQRLRRLREEADQEARFWGPRPDAIPMPSAGQEARAPEYVETLVEVVELNSDGELQAFMHATVADANASPFEKIVHRNWITRIDDDEKISSNRKALMTYPRTAPRTDVALQMKASDHARLRSAITIGINRASGGIGKNEISANETAPSA